MSSTANKNAIAYALRTSKMMLRYFTEDFTPEEYLHRPTEKSNCTAWLIGHLALSDRGVAKALGATDLPELPAGFEKQFSREEGCPQARSFGDVKALLPIFEKHRDILAAAVERASSEQLNAPAPRQSRMFATVGEMAHFMALHAAIHAGQITIIRRSLGRPPLV